MVYHEYSHAVIDDQNGGISSASSNEEGAISEGVPDYYAGAHTGRTKILDYAYPPLQRDMAIPVIGSYSEYQNQSPVEPHDGGEFFSAVLWDLRNDSDITGGEVDYLVYAALSYVSANPTFRAFRDAMIAEDNAEYGGQHVQTITGAFDSRGIGRTFVAAYMSNQTVSGNKTYGIGDDILVGNGVTVTYSGDVTIDHRVSFYMEKNAKIVFKGQVDADGTHDQPVRFRPREYGGDEWDEVVIDGDNSTLNQIVVRGSTNGMLVTSNGTTISDSRFDENDYGLRSDYSDGRYYSYFTVENSFIESSDANGLTAKHADVTLKDVTIRNNNQAGVYVTCGGSIEEIRRTLITGNDGGGVDIDCGGLFGGEEMASLSTIEDNPESEIEILSDGGSLTFGYYDLSLSFSISGKNKIGDGSPSGYSVLNQSNDVAKVQKDYFSGGKHFGGSGTVDASYELSNDPTSNPGADESYVPDYQIKESPSIAVHQAALRVSTENRHSSSRVFVASGESSSGGSQSREVLGDRMKEVRGKLQSHPQSMAISAKLLRTLYLLQRIDRKDELGEMSINMSVFTRWADRLSRGSHMSRARRASEAAAVAAVRTALYARKLEKASRLIETFDEHVEGENNRRALLMSRVALLEGKGRFEEALAVFKRFEAIGYASAEDSLRKSYLKRELRAKAASGSAYTEQRVENREAEGAEEAAKQATTQEQIVWKAAYPNPARDRATLPMKLPEAAQVHAEVYDVMGRRVATLADGALSAGTHRLTLKAGDLPGGVYVVRAQVTTRSGEKRVFTRKVTVAR